MRFLRFLASLPYTILIGAALLWWALVGLVGACFIWLGRWLVKQAIRYVTSILRETKVVKEEKV